MAEADARLALRDFRCRGTRTCGMLEMLPPDGRTPAASISAEKKKNESNEELYTNNECEVNQD